MFACFANLKKGLDVRARDFGSLADWLRVLRRALTPLAKGILWKVRLVQAQSSGAKLLRSKTLANLFSMRGNISPISTLYVETRSLYF